MVLRLRGGGKKRKKKNYTTPKKNKHKKKKVKLAVLKYYKVSSVCVTWTLDCKWLKSGLLTQWLSTGFVIKCCLDMGSNTSWDILIFFLLFKLCCELGTTVHWHCHALVLGLYLILKLIRNMLILFHFGDKNTEFKILKKKSNILLINFKFTNYN